MKKHLFLTTLFVAGLTLSLTSCWSHKSKFNDEEISKTFVKKDIPLINKSVDYNIDGNSISTYFINDGNVPYIGIKELLVKLNGFFISNYYSYSYDSWHEKGRISAINDKYYMDINCKADTITLNSNQLFEFINSPEGIDYQSNSELVNVRATNINKVVYNLEKYDFNALQYNDDIILPLSILKMIVLSPTVADLQFNGENFYFFSTYITNTNDEYSIRNKDLEGKSIPQDILEERNNQFYFYMDYFYGLRKYYKINDFKKYISSIPELYNLLNSNDPNDSKLFFNNFILKVLNEPHSTTVFKSFYNEVQTLNDISMIDSYSDYGERTTNLIEVQNYLIDLYKSTFNEFYVSNIYDDTCFIKFNEFKVGRDDQIYDEYGNFKKDAFKYDTVILLKEALEYARDEKCKNVVLDLSTNGGGVLSSAQRCIGYLTNKNVEVPLEDLLYEQKLIYSYAVDADYDGSYTDLDAFEEFNYYILTSKATFSAANFFTSICKDMGIVKIIGEQSGGGMCAVSPCSLIDGTLFNTSSNLACISAKRSGNKYKFNETESGIKVDYPIPLEKFYDFEYIDSIIETL